ncbi:MAG: ParA family protein [Deltaproteobacteria bacterium]|nr:ParA family protein [Candidatus Anaeroferrophillacea bacterium]
MIVIALYNIKGGVGKTAAAVNLAFEAARDGKKTLLVDLDPQGSASYYFRVRPAKKLKGKQLVSADDKLEAAIRGTDYPHLDLLPATFSFRKLDQLLDGAKHSKTRLGHTLAAFGGDYHYVILDCPPNITLASENVFNAADWIVVPTIPTTLSLRTWEQLNRFFADKRLPEGKLRPFLSMAETRKRMHREVLDELPETEPRLLPTVIPYLADIEQMGEYRAPVAAARPHSRGGRAYRQLWRDIEAVMAEG